MPLFKFIFLLIAIPIIITDPIDTKKIEMVPSEKIWEPYTDVEGDLSFIAPGYFSPGIPYKIHSGNGFQIDVPDSWEIKELDSFRTLFIGPRIGNANLGLYVTRIEKNSKTYLDAAEGTKAQQKNFPNYKVLEEKDISQSGYKAYLRWSSWYEKDIDMTLFVREIFTESEDTIYMLSATVPNSPQFAELDKLVVSVMNTFKFSPIKEKQN